MLRLLVATMISSLLVLPAMASCPPGSILIKDQELSVHLRKVDKLRILAIGSSSTQGSGASSADNAYPNKLEILLRERLQGIDVIVTNAGVGGEEAGETSKRLSALLEEHAYDLVIWQVGTNDAVRGGNIEGLKQNIYDGAAAARQSRVPLILMDQQWYESIRDPLRYERFVAVIKEVADELGLRLLHRYGLMKKWAASEPRDYHRFMSADGFHMGDRGYECLARAIVRSLRVIRND